MAINIRCKNCKAEMKLSAKKCKKCGTPIPKKGKIYKVIVRVNNKRVTKTVNNLELAKEIESKFKIDIARKTFNLERKKPAIKLCEVWKQYLPWAKQNKKTWRDDFYNYKKHIEPLFSDKQLDEITAFDVEKLISSMKEKKNVRGKPYAMGTIRHQIILLSRLYSLANKWELFTGDNPCQKVKKPKLNNQITEFLKDDELKSLLETLDNWQNKMSSSFIKFALYTGLRHGELFKLTWEDIDFDRSIVTLRDPKGKQNQDTAFI
jgi:integrase